mgnify:FL=1
MEKSGIIYGGDVDAISAYDESTGTLRVMAYNFKNTLDYKTDVELTFNISAPQLDGKKVKVTQYVIDDSCNYFDEWVEDRIAYGITDDKFCWSPDDPSIDNPTTLKDEKARETYFNELYPKYTRCSQLIPTESEATVTNDTLTLNTTLAPHGVVVYEITINE